MYYATDLWNKDFSYLAHYGVKGMKWGHRKLIESTYNPRYRRQRYVKYNGVFGSVGKKSKSSKMPIGARIALGTGGALLAYSAAKKLAYSGAGIKDPKIFSNYIKINKEIAKQTIGRIAPVMARSTMSSIKKTMPATMEFLKKAAKVTQSKIVPAITKPYVKSVSNFGAAVTKQTRKNGLRMAKSIIGATTVKVNNIGIPFAKMYTSDLLKMRNNNPKKEKTRRKELRKMDRNEWWLRL